MISVDEGVGVTVQILCCGVDEGGGGGGGGEEGEGGIVRIRCGSLFVVRDEIWLEEVEVLFVLSPGNIVVVWSTPSQRGGQGRAVGD